MGRTMDSFKALLIEERDGKVVNGFVRMTESQLDSGNVTIRVAYSSVNYKDALAATGAGRILRKYPLVGGIDLAGTVVSSTDARWHAPSRAPRTVRSPSATDATCRRGRRRRAGSPRWR